MRHALIASLLACLCLPASQAQPLLPPEQSHADLTAFYEGLQDAHYDLYAHTPKAVFDQRYVELGARLQAAPISPAELHTALQRFAALARIAHTRVEGLNPGFSTYLDQAPQLFPLGFEVTDGEVVVTHTPAHLGLHPGDKILSLQGLSNSDWLSRLTRNISADTPALAYAQMEGMEPYYVWLEFGAVSVFDVEIETASGSRQTLRLPAITLDGLAERDGPAGASQAPREAYLVDETIAYLRPGPFYNIDAETPQQAYDPVALGVYQDFIDQSFESFIEADAQVLILDLRDNPGGDYSWSDPVIAWFADRPFRFASDFRIRVSAQTTASNQARIDALPAGASETSLQLAALYETAEDGALVSFELPISQPRQGPQFEGQVYALINRHSYSNAVSAGAIIQDYGFGSVIGEATTDMTTTFGAMEQFTLPHSEIVVGYPKALIIRPNGDEQAAPLYPDSALNTSEFEDHEDPLLAAALAYINEGLN